MITTCVDNESVYVIVKINKNLILTITAPGNNFFTNFKIINFSYKEHLKHLLENYPTTKQYLNKTYKEQNGY